MGLIRVGNRVKARSIGIKGTVEYIDYPYLYRDHMYPIQILLDKPHDTQMIYRTGLKDIIRLKKKVVDEPDYVGEIKQFLKWLDKY